MEMKDATAVIFQELSTTREIMAPQLKETIPIKERTQDAKFPKLSQALRSWLKRQNLSKATVILL